MQVKLNIGHHCLCPPMNVWKTIVHLERRRSGQPTLSSLRPIRRPIKRLCAILTYNTISVFYISHMFCFTSYLLTCINSWSFLPFIYTINGFESHVASLSHTVYDVRYLIYYIWCMVYWIYVWCIVYQCMLYSVQYIVYALLYMVCCISMYGILYIVFDIFKKYAPCRHWICHMFKEWHHTQCPNVSINVF